MISLIVIQVSDNGRNNSRNQNRNLFLSTRINDLHSGDNVQSQAIKQHKLDSPHIHDPAGLRFVIDDRCNVGNERQSTFNGQNLVNGHHNPVNDHHISVNGNHIRQTPHKTNNDVAKSDVNPHTSNTIHTELTNGLTTTSNGSEKTPDRPSSKPNGYPIRNHQNNVDHKNGINRLSNGNEKPTNLQLQKEDAFNIAANLRQLLKPTVIKKRQEISKAEYDTEDINGPYNFRQLLRPTGYLPTESLRKRKGGMVSNRVPLPKDKVPEKHVKRRAPLAPTQNKLVNGKK